MIYKRLLEPAKLNGNFFQNIERAMDVREFRKLDLDMRILKDGTGGDFRVQHAVINEPDAYIDIPGALVVFGNGIGSHHISIDDFLGFIRVIGVGAAGDPVVLVDAIARP